MDNVHHLTLASIRDEDPETFDKLIKQAVHEAADIIGTHSVLLAFSDSQHNAGEIKAA